MEIHPEGLFLEAETYNALVRTIQRDCLVLESFKIMDYSLLVGVHNLDLSAREKAVRLITPDCQIKTQNTHLRKQPINGARDSAG